MAAAFQASAFQNNAFQVASPSPGVVSDGGYWKEEKGYKWPDLGKEILDTVRRIADGEPEPDDIPVEVAREVRALPSVAAISMPDRYALERQVMAEVSRYLAFVREQERLELEADDDDAITILLEGI